MRSTLMVSATLAVAVSLVACGRDEAPEAPATPAEPVPMQPAPTTAPDPAWSDGEDTKDTDADQWLEEADLDPEQREAIEAQRARGEETTDGDGTDGQGTVRSHTEAETALDPEEADEDEDEDDGLL